MYDIKELHDKVKKPGIYFHMPDTEYHSDWSISNSGMGDLLKSPRRYWHKSNMNPEKESIDTIDMRKGRVLHTLLLEPQNFHKDWKIKPGVQNSTSPGMIGEGAYKDLCAAVKALRSDNVFGRLFQGGFAEVSIFWIDEETQVPCRARIDYLTPYFAGDLKSTTDVSDYSLGYSIVDYGYYRQAAFYLHGLGMVKQAIRENKASFYNNGDEAWYELFMNNAQESFGFVWQEKTAPYTTRADELCERTIELGRNSFRKALHLFKANYEKYGTAPWPSGYEGRVGIIQLDDLPPKINYAF